MRTHWHLEERFVHRREHNDTAKQIELHSQNTFNVQVSIATVVTFRGIVFVCEIKVVTFFVVETNIVSRRTAFHLTSANNTVALAPHREIEGDFHILLVDVIDQVIDLDIRDRSTVTSVNNCL
ncbi:hypothetical protein D3C81_1806670 [compost metagenome]